VSNVLEDNTTEIVSRDLLVGSNLHPCQKVISFSDLTAFSDTIPLPRKYVDAIVLIAKYKVTDVGISSGETFFGQVDRISIGQQGDYRIEFRSDEMVPFVKFLNGFATGQYADPMPTTATTAYAYCVLKGPFDFSNMSDPTVFLELKAATAEWSAASAYELEFSVLVLLSDMSSGPSLKVERIYKPTSTRHEILNLGTGVVEDVLLKNGTSVYYTNRISIDDGTGSQAQVFPRPFELNYVFNAHAYDTDTTMMLLRHVDIAYSSRRQIVLENGTTDTLLVFAKNLISA
jgi:hypothetical protein